MVTFSKDYKDSKGQIEDPKNQLFYRLDQIINLDDLFWLRSAKMLLSVFLDERYMLDSAEDMLMYNPPHHAHFNKKRTDPDTGFFVIDVYETHPNKMERIFEIEGWCLEEEKTTQKVLLTKCFFLPKEIDIVAGWDLWQGEMEKIRKESYENYKQTTLGLLKDGAFTP